MNDALSLKYSAIEVAEYGAKNCNGAGSDAVAATTIEYSKAPVSPASLSCATVDLFCPIAT